MILTGMTLEAIGHLDMLTFNALLSSVLRVSYQQRTEAAYTSMLAAQGTAKAMKDWVKGWAKVTGEKPSKAGMAEFLKAFGAGM